MRKLKPLYHLLQQLTYFPKCPPPPKPPHVLLKLCPFVVAATLMTLSEALSFDSISEKEGESRRWRGG